MHLKEYLAETARTIRSLEEQAKQCLGTEYSKEYDMLMHKKANILADLYYNAQKQDSGQVQNLAEIQKKLRTFSRSAETALSLNSSWYMFALLYPEDYKNGEPNNLEKLIQEIKLKQ